MQNFLMIVRVTKFFIFLSIVFSIVSCLSSPTKFGTKTEIFDKKDSLKSLAKIKEIKALDYSDFKPGKFKDDKAEVNYRLLKPKNLDKTKSIL